MMAVEITVRFPVGEKMLTITAPPAAIFKMVDQRTKGRSAELFKRIADDSLALIDVMAILRVFDRDPVVLKYLENLIAGDSAAEAAAREGAAALIMIALAGAGAAGRASRTTKTSEPGPSGPECNGGGHLPGLTPQQAPSAS